MAKASLSFTKVTAKPTSGIVANRVYFVKDATTGEVSIGISDNTGTNVNYVTGGGGGSITAPSIEPLFMAGLM